MNGSINAVSGGSDTLQAHLNVVTDCINQISQALTLSRDAIKGYASKVMSRFVGGGNRNDDFLLVDRMIYTIKKLTHHVREILNDMKSGGTYTQNHALIATMNEYIATLETAQRGSSFLQRTFGWALQEPMNMMKEISNVYQIK